MINIKIENREYSLPENWEEVKLSQLINVTNISKDKLNSDILTMIKTLTVLSDDERFEDDVKSLDYQDVEILFKEFDWIGVEPDITQIPKKEILEIDGQRFKIKKDYDKLSINEVVIIEELMKSSRLDLNHIEVTFGVLFRKLDADGKELPLTIDLVLETILNFRDKVYLKDIYAVISFFGYGEASGSKTSPSSSRMTITRANKKKNTKKKIKKK